MTDPPPGEEALTADAFRQAPASTRRVTPVPLPPPAPEETPEESAPPAPAPPAGEQPPGAGGPSGAWQYPHPGGDPAGVLEQRDRPRSGPGPVHEESPPPGPHQAYSFGQFQQQAPVNVPDSPAQWGWRGRVRRLTGGRISPAMSQEEAGHRSAVDQVQAHMSGPKTIVFVNPKGGATTTTSTLMAGRTFGVHRGGGVVAWDNNETRGTLGQRARPVGHWNTARELLDNVKMFEGASARIGDLGLYVRGQGGAHFDVLASDERPEVTGHIDAAEVGQLHGLFQRFYKLILIDTGNNMRAPNFLAAVAAADLLVLTTTVRRDSAAAGLWMLDGLERDVYGPGNLKRRTVTVLAEPSPHTDPGARREMTNIFSARTRAVMPIPYDPGLTDGGVVNYDRLTPATHSAWVFACAQMSAALQEQQWAQ